MTEIVKICRNSGEFRYQRSAQTVKPVAEVATLPKERHGTEAVKSRRNSGEFRYQIGADCQTGSGSGHTSEKGVT